MSQEERKNAVARAALEYVEDDSVIGIGTGSTVNFFIEALASVKHRIEGAIASSVASETLLKEHGIPVVPLNSVIEIPVYVDGADEATRNKHLIKGGGGAVTREKIVAAASNHFICIVDDSKIVPMLGKFPLPVEVIPMAQSYVARQLAGQGGRPVLREGFTTDNGNIIIDVHNLEIDNPVQLEQLLNQVAGVVTSGLFAQRGADIILIADAAGITRIE